MGDGRKALAPNQMQRYKYGTSSSGSFDFGETDSKDRSPALPLESGSTVSANDGRPMELDQIEIVRREGSLTETASNVTDASGMETLYGSSRMRKMSDEPLSAPPPPSLHRGRTAHDGNLSNQSTRTAHPNGNDELKLSKKTRMPNSSASGKRLVPPTRKRTPLTHTQGNRCQASRLRKPSPCPITDQPGRPRRKITPGYFESTKDPVSESPPEAPSESACQPSPTKILSPTIRRSNQKFPIKRAGSWKSVDFSGETNNLPTKSPQATMGLRRWRETPDTSFDSEDIESQPTSSEAFGNESRRISSLTFSTHQAPAAPTENVADEATHDVKDISFDGSNVFEEATTTEMPRWAGGKAMSNVVYEGMFIGEKATVDTSPWMVCTSSSRQSIETENETIDQTSASMAMAPEGEVQTAPATQACGSDQSGKPSSSSLWRESVQSLRSMMVASSRSGGDDGLADLPRESSSHGDDGQADFPSSNNPNESSGIRIRSLVTATWSSLLPSQRMESLVSAMKAKAETGTDRNSKRIRPCVIYTLLVSCVVLVGVITFLAVLLGRKESR